MIQGLRRMGRSLIAVGTSWLALSASMQLAADDITMMLDNGAISAQHVAFTYDGDLWIANRDGSQPRRLSSHQGTEVNPRFSPDGQSLAFTAEYDGNLDVYLVSVQGGMPQRLTYHPSPDVVEGFTPDGQSVVFSSGQQVFTNRYRKLFTVSVAGGFPTELPIPNGLSASYSADGRKIAYNPIPPRFAQWKNYRGGTVSRVWIYDTQDHSVQIVRQPEGRCNDADPMYLGDAVYFRSDRNGEFNLFRFDPKTEAVEQLTHFTDFPVTRVNGCADAIIFEQAGKLHTFSLADRAIATLPIRVTSDLNELRPRFVTGDRWIRNMSLSPSGARTAFEYRGEILTLPAAKGDMRNLTETTGVNERSPAWSPDGSKIAFFSDAGGEYQLHIVPQDGKGTAEIHKVEGHGFYEEPRWSPDGLKISYRDNSWSLYIYDLAKKQSTKICSAPVYGPPTIRGLHHAWSPDSRWLAYTVNTAAAIQQAWLYQVEEGKSYPVSDGMSEVAEPVFDRGGKHLFFVASTDAGPVKDWFAQSNNDMVLSNQIYVAVLRDSDPNPLAPESDEERATANAAANAAGTTAPANAAAPNAAAAPADAADKNRVVVDFAGLDQRILALPLPPAVYSQLESGPDGVLYFVKTNRNGESELGSFSLKSREAGTVLPGANGFEISRDGKKILYAVGNTIGVTALAPKIAPGTGKLPTDKLTVKIDPRAEWLQIFDEVWRINRDYFYDPNMHGSKWPQMRDKYRPFVAHCVTRNDLNRVLTWMCSELAVGHHNVGGGDQRLEAGRVPGGLLGADFEVVDGKYRIKKVLGGLNWNGQLRAPLTEPGVRAKVGEYILAVNGEPLVGTDNIFRHFENTAGKSVEITLGPNADGSQSRVVTVVPIADESELRNRDWIEGNLKRVTEATQGRVAYVYVPNTTTQGHAYFKRYFFPQSNRDAIIIDERFNGGGQIADYYIDHLRRPYLSHWATRYGNDFRTPTSSILGPKVMLIDETAGSGGDMLPWMFRQLKMGTLVGRRTWGGLVGILGFPTLMDGGFITAPNLAIWTEDGFIVENEGVPPDVEVEQWPADVIAGRDPQLEKAIEIALKQLESDPPKQYKKPPYPIRSRN